MNPVRKTSDQEIAELFVRDEILKQAPHLEPEGDAVVAEVIDDPDFEAMIRHLTRRAIGRRSAVSTTSERRRVKVVNLTPHDVTFYSQDGTRVIGNIPTGRQVTRVEHRASIVLPADLELEDGTVIEDIPLFYQGQEVTTDLPDPVPGLYYIVSSMVKDACPHRSDLFAVNTTNNMLGSVKTPEGHVIGTRSLRPASPDVFRHLL